MDVNTTINIDGVENISPLDALWALFQSQPKSIRKAFTERMLQDEEYVDYINNRTYIMQTMKRSLHEMRIAEAAGVELPDAHELFINY